MSAFNHKRPASPSTPDEGGARREWSGAARVGGDAPDPTPATPSTPLVALVQADASAPNAVPGAGWAHGCGPRRTGAETVAADTTLAITIYAGATYDGVYRDVHALARNRDTLVVYAAQAQHLDALHAVLRGARAPLGWEALARDLAAATPASVIVNFECSAGAADAFQGADAIAIAAIAARERGHAVNFADYSLKALLRAWTAGSAAEERFGLACPFAEASSAVSRHVRPKQPRAHAAA